MDKRINVKRELPTEAETVLADDMVAIFNRLQNDLDCVYAKILNASVSDPKMRRLILGELERLLERAPVYCARYMKTGLSL